MKKNDYVLEMMPDVRTAARTTGREWEDVIDSDDAEQEILIRLLELTETKLRELYELERPVRIKLLTEIGHQVGMKYRDDYELFSGNHTYGTRDVRKMLENDALAGVDEESGVPLWELPESVISQITRTESETVSERIDLLLGMKKLVHRNARYGFLIQEKYVRGVEFANEDPDRKAVDRAVDALTREMNNTRRRRVAEYEDGPGARTPVSSTKASRMSSTDWQGDILDGRR